MSGIAGTQPLALAAISERLDGFSNVLNASSSVPLEIGSTLPNTVDLVALLVRQDTLLAELFHELSGCKAELVQIREQSSTASREVSTLYEELKTQLTSSMSTDYNNKLDTNAMPKSLPPTTDITGACASCAENIARTAVAVNERNQLRADNQRLTLELNRYEERVSEAYIKVKKAVAAVEISNKNKTELEQLVHDLENRCEKLSTERMHASASHRSELASNLEEQEKKYHLQLEEYRKQIEALSASEIRLKATIERLDLQRTDLITEADQLRQFLRKEQSYLDEHTNSLRNDVTLLQREKTQLMDECTKLRNRVEFLENSREKERELEELRISETKNLANDLRKNVAVLKEENARLQEQLFSHQKQNLHLEQANARLEDQMRDLALQKDTSASQTVKELELKHAQNRGDLESLLLVQSNLTGRLRDECRILHEQLEQQTKQHRRDVKKWKRRETQLKRTGRELATKLDNRAYDSS